MTRLTRDKANAYLSEAARMNPGGWVAHSAHVALAARTLADPLGLDAELAEAYGLVHDIGRRFGVTGLRHSLDGYLFLTEEGYPDAARICVTHSWPTFHVGDMVGEWDGTADEFAEVERVLAARGPDDMDRLIQLCDAIALPDGFTVLERRLVDVGMRYGVGKTTPKRWKAYLDIKADFEGRLDASIYDLLPGEVML